VASYAILTLLAADLSLGLNGLTYGWIAEHVPAMDGLRSPSRFSIVTLCGLAALAAAGVRSLQRAAAAGEAASTEDGARRPPFLTRHRPALLVTGVVFLMLIEYGNRGMYIGPVQHAPLDVYRAMASVGPGVVLELPLPTADRLPGRDWQYAFWSTAHWHPLVNGYSGYYPAGYIETLERMRTFPDAGSIARLRRMDVRYIVVHRALMEPAAYSALALRMAARPELRPYGSYRDPAGMADLFVLE
jgi:hypothetical protein